MNWRTTIKIQLHRLKFCFESTLQKVGSLIWMLPLSTNRRTANRSWLSTYWWCWWIWRPVVLRIHQFIPSRHSCNFCKFMVSILSIQELRLDRKYKIPPLMQKRRVSKLEVFIQKCLKCFVIESPGEHKGYNDHINGSYWWHSYFCTSKSRQWWNFYGVSTTCAKRIFLFPVTIL